MQNGKNQSMTDPL